MRERSDRQKRGKNAIKDELGGGVQTNGPACSPCCGFCQCEGCYRRVGTLEMAAWLRSVGVVSADREEEFRGGKPSENCEEFGLIARTEAESPTIRCNAAKHVGVRNSFQQPGVVCLDLLMIMIMYCFTYWVFSNRGVTMPRMNVCDALERHLGHLDNVSGDAVGRAKEPGLLLIPDLDEARMTTPSCPDAFPFSVLSPGDDDLEAEPVGRRPLCF